MLRAELADHYQRAGIAEEAWNVGPEHPALEDTALALLASLDSRQVLEIGFQSGGFAVPVILALQRDAAFHYIGVDNLAYRNAVTPATIDAFLRPRVGRPCYEFVVSGSSEWLRKMPEGSIDLALLDHFKPMYERDLLLLCRRRIVRPGGAILLHDVRAGAARAWRECQHLVRTFNLSVELREDVPAGLAVLRVPRGGEPPNAARVAASRAKSMARSAVFDALRGRGIGPLLRGLGLRA
jgi:predicted O-methyltransferase YrrM